MDHKECLRWEFGFISLSFSLKELDHYFDVHATSTRIFISSILVTIVVFNRMCPAKVAIFIIVMNLF